MIHPSLNNSSYSPHLLESMVIIMILLLLVYFSKFIFFVSKIIEWVSHACRGGKEPSIPILVINGCKSNVYQCMRQLPYSASSPARACLPK